MMKFKPMDDCEVHGVWVREIPEIGLPPEVSKKVGPPHLFEVPVVTLQ